VDKILLVGNGGSLKDKNISDIIDSFDIVCRFNWGGSKVSFDKYSKFIGTRKNVWFNFNISNLIKDRKITTNPYNIDYLNSYDKIYVSGIDWVTYPQVMVTTNSFENFVDLTSDQFDFLRNSELANLNEIFDTELNNIWIFPNNYSELIRLKIPSLSENIATTGLKAIHFLLGQYEKLYLCGFDGFKSSHFYGDDGHNNIVKLGYENDDGHSGRREMIYLKELEKQNKIEFVN
tara:strand:- start:10 stop:708 length:699 start_codon:yes stop_codon:yes gene_type:complete